MHIFHKCEFINKILNGKLTILVNEEEQSSHKFESVHQSELQRCKFLLNQALDADEAGCKDIAIKLYTEAAALGLNTVSVVLLLLILLYIC